MAVQARREPPSPFAALLRRGRPSWVAILGLVFVALIFLWLLVNLIQEPQVFINIFLIGLTNGSTYALIALGYTLVYGILQLINFAHGDVFALSGLVSSTILLSVFDLNSPNEAAGAIALGIAVALLVAMAFGSAVNTSIEFIAYRRLRRAPRLAPLISAIGMSFFLQGVGLYFWGVQYTTTPALIPDTNVFTIGKVGYQWDKLATVLLTVPLLLLLLWLVTSTRQGKAMRATSQDPDAAAMMGINVNRTISFTFGLAGALAGSAGLLYLMQFTVIRYDQGFQLGLIAFTAAVLGGIGNLTGAVLGGVLIGFVEAFNEGLSWASPGSDWTRTIVFGLLIAILVFRPEGLLGERTPEGG
jgi:branched-chain amino acid transport system permease protein